MIELSDALSIFENKGQTLTSERVRKGTMRGANIQMHFLDTDIEKILMSCTVGKDTTYVLLTPETRLPCEMPKKVALNDYSFLFTDSGEFVGDISDDDNAVKYDLRNRFFDDYREVPLRDLLSPENLQMEIAMYVPVQGKKENVDFLVAIQLGNQLDKNPGLLSYYEGRIIDKDFVEIT